MNISADNRILKWITFVSRVIIILRSSFPEKYFLLENICYLYTTLLVYFNTCIRQYIYTLSKINKKINNKQISFLADENASLPSICHLYPLILTNILGLLHNLYMLLRVTIACLLLKTKCGAFIVRLHGHST